MTVFPGVTEETCEIAWSMILPAIEKAYADGLTNGLRGTIIVLDPAEPEVDNPVFVAHVGEPDSAFLTNVEGKVKVTIRTGLDSSRVRQDFPHLYRAGDIKYPGAINREGLIVAFSGVQGDFDEMICEWMVAALRAIGRDRFSRPGGADDAEGAYL
ncbi:hypothetical protein [Demequina sp. NBRC 110056]|uniref:hypothetical protein n=1 Tax=Demequina sp. NBRC 110056 TaxID=1570345 RepID=UPI0009FD1833|nr:hypothetical protein [Demequina sp. NBRC 110056]